jgi:hypothetical protein
MPLAPLQRPAFDVDRGEVHTWQWYLVCFLIVLGLLLVAASTHSGEPAPRLCLPAAGIDPDAPCPDEGKPQQEPEVKAFGLRRLGYDARYLLRRPCDIDHSDRKRLAATFMTTGGLYLLRDEIREFAAKNRGESRSRFLEDIRWMGKGRASATLALGFLLLSAATDNDREKETAQMLLESAAFSALLAGAGSVVLATERPEDGDAIRFFDTSGRGVSVDAAVAAALVEPLRCQYLYARSDDSRAARFWKRVGSGFLYTCAGLVAYQRIDADKHWAPDAFLGMMTGLAVGRTLCEAHGRTGSSPRIAAWPTPGGAYLSVSFTL